MLRIACLLLLLCFFTACASQPTARVLLNADGTQRLAAIGESQTVGDLLQREGIILGGEDRVEPPSFTLLSPEMIVQVVRVRTWDVEEEQAVPFGREVRRDASLPQGESRLLQLGTNGREAITIQVTSENGVEIARKEIGRKIVEAPINEVYVIGTRGSGTPVSFEGTIVYLQQGNAWLMREDSSRKRALTLTGDLDGLVFALSPDGRWLLFSREPIGGASGQGGPLNSLWLLDTRIINEEPRPLDIENVLWAEWQPCNMESACPMQVAYSTGARVPNPPGWRANNDLRRFGLSSDGIRGEVVPVIAPSLPIFGWWGRQWRWSPTGNDIAWADATRLGVISLDRRSERVLAEFHPYETRAAWVWTPQLAWSPDGRYLAATVHRAGDGASPQSSTRFDLMRFDPSKNEFIVLEENVGPFASPTWLDSSRMLYGQVEDPTHPVTSRYTIMARQGSGDPQPVFPAAEQPGVDVPLTVTNPTRDTVLTVWQGDLYWLQPGGALPRALTNEGGTSHPRWAP